MIMMWPCPKCKMLSTSPDGCLAHRPERPEQTFEEELMAALMTRSERRTDGVVVSGMTFERRQDLGPFDICSCAGNEFCSNCP